MHIPQIFEQDDSAQLKGIIRTYPFATLITYSDSGLEANHIPFFLNRSDNKDVLQGHISKTNPLWKKLNDKSEVLVVFHGPNSYISPGYYPTKLETGKVVPTWNYVTVHVKGVMSYIHDQNWNMAMIENLTNQHEADQPSPWSISDAPEEFNQKMLSAIVGIEIEISSMVGKWKASQNQPERNKQGVVAGLSKSSDINVQRMATIVNDYLLEE